MMSKYFTIGTTAIAAAALAAAIAQAGANRVASGQREILRQTTQSWNGKPYTHLRYSAAALL
jgi:hypothetical protein